MRSGQPITPEVVKLIPSHEILFAGTVRLHPKTTECRKYRRSQHDTPKTAHNRPMHAKFRYPKQVLLAPPA